MPGSGVRSGSGEGGKQTGSVSVLTSGRRATRSGALWSIRTHPAAERESWSDRRGRGSETVQRREGRFFFFNCQPTVDITVPDEAPASPDRAAPRPASLGSLCHRQEQAISCTKMGGIDHPAPRDRAPHTARNPGQGCAFAPHPRLRAHNESPRLSQQEAIISRWCRHEPWLEESVQCGAHLLCVEPVVCLPIVFPFRLFFAAPPRFSLMGVHDRTCDRGDPCRRPHSARARPRRSGQCRTGLSPKLTKVGPPGEATTTPDTLEARRARGGGRARGPDMLQ
jgi:hypothetical protein